MATIPRLIVVSSSGGAVGSDHNANFDLTVERDGAQIRLTISAVGKPIFSAIEPEGAEFSVTLP